MFKVQIHVHSSCEKISPKIITAFQADQNSVTRAATVHLRLRMGKQQKNFEDQRCNLKATIRLGGNKRKDNFNTFINKYTGKIVWKIAVVWLVSFIMLFTNSDTVELWLLQGKFFSNTAFTEDPFIFVNWSKEVRKHRFYTHICFTVSTATAYQLSTMYRHLDFSGEMGSG